MMAPNAARHKVIALTINLGEYVLECADKRKFGFNSILGDVMSVEPVMIDTRVDTHKFSDADNRRHTQPRALLEPPDRAREVLLEQMRLFHRNFLQGSYVNIPGHFVVMATLWNMGARTLVIAWFVTAVSCDVIDQLLARRTFRTMALNLENAPSYARRFTIALGIGGVMWGCAGFFIAATESAGYELWIVTVLTMVQLAGCTGCAGYLPAVYWWIGPITLSLVINLTFFSNLPFSGIYLAFGVLVSSIANLLFSHNYHGVLTQSILLNIRNRELAAENAEKKEEAEKANRGKSAFLASASHDLRQPMQAIRLLVANLYSTSQTPDSRVLLDQMRESVEAMGSQLDFLLDISRLDSGTVEPKIVEFSLNQLFKHMQLQYGPLAQAKKLSFDVGPADIGVKSDPDLLERILQNFISNAIRFTDAGSISLTCVQEGESVRIDVSDTGTGIPHSELGSIFDVLKQLGNAERDHRKGTGLGLGIVDRLAKVLDHPVTVSSELGKGSRFSVTIPVSNVPIPLAPEAESVADISVAGAFVVIIEDNPIILESLGRLLVNWECPVVGALTLNAAIAALAEHDRVPDLIISDYRLPNYETGIDAIAAIRALTKTAVPAIVITGDTDVEISRRVSELGIALLRKPVTPAELKRAMAHSLEPSQTSL
jgi:two-component system, sensor histidine kinase